MNEIKPQLQQLLDAPGEQKPLMFFNYCRKLIVAKNQGDITLESAGHEIADAMYVRELDDPLFAEITSLAGRLELPHHTKAVNADAAWDYLVALVLEYGARYTEKVSL